MIAGIPIRQAIRKVLKAAFVAKETNNRELLLDCRDWLRNNVRHRHSGMKWYFNR